MRPTFLGFETARKGLAVTQKGLDIVGHNMTNVNTAGYTRQRVDVYSISPNNARNRYATSRAEFAGQGVGMSGVSQVRDSFLDKRFRDEFTDVGYYDKVSAAMEDIEAAIDEYGSDTGMENSIKEVVKALSDFSGNPDSKVHANVVATAFKNIVQTLHQYDAKLKNVEAQQKEDLSIAVKDVNNIFAKLAGLNNTIGSDVSARVAQDGQYYGPNELLDERNLLIDELSRYGEVQTKQNADGTVTVTMAGRTVVDGTKTDKLNYRSNNDGTVSLTWNSDGKRYSSPEAGTLQGSLDMINGRGPYVQSANEGNERGIPFYKDKINTMSKTLVSTFNNIVPEVDANGDIMTNPDGSTIFKQLLGARTTDGNGNVTVQANLPINAGNISLSDAWTANSNYVIFKQGDKEGTYAHAMHNAMSTQKQDFKMGGSTQKMTFEEYVRDYATICGGDSNFNKGRLDASAAIADEILNRRDNVSAVAPDEETANMMLYNKSYQAIARLMTSMDEALDVLINRTGMVGR